MSVINFNTNRIYK